MYIDFVDGAKDGFATVIKVMPTLIGLMVAVGMLRESGAMDFCGKQIGKVTKYIGFPGELVPLNIVKIFSSSAATGMLLDVYKKYGVDSYIANVASIILSSIRNDFLHDVGLFYDCKGNKDKMDSSGSIICHSCRNNCKCNGS